MNLYTLSRTLLQFSLLALLGFAAACSSTPTATPPAASGTGIQATQPTTGAASTIPPQQRNDMYKTAPPMSIDVTKTYRATIQTGKGNIVIDLYPQDAPKTVNNFVFLARDGFYNGLTFHRYEPGFVIQGGDPLGDGRGGPGYDIPPEIKRTHPVGAVATARLGGPPETTPSSGSQFYIALQPLPQLDGSYTVFGQATADSMNVVNQIRAGDVINQITIEEK